MNRLVIAALACVGVSAVHAGAAAAVSAQSSGTAIPKQMLGQWVVASVAGAAPMSLEADSSQDMVGRHIKIEPDQVSIWNAIAGTPGEVEKMTGTLSAVIAEPDSMKQGYDFPDSSRDLTYIAIGLSDCTSDGTALPNGCPHLYFAIDPKTGGVSFIPFAWGMAYMKRVKD